MQQFMIIHVNHPIPTKHHLDDPYYVENPYWTMASKGMFSMNDGILTSWSLFSHVFPLSLSHPMTPDWWVIHILKSPGIFSQIHLEVHAAPAQVSRFEGNQKQDRLQILRSQVRQLDVSVSRRVRISMWSWEKRDPIASGLISIYFSYHEVSE